MRETRCFLLAEMTVASSSSHASNPLDQLSEREQQILQLVAAGHSNKEIGQQLHLSEKTVKHHMTNILTETACPQSCGGGVIGPTAANRCKKI